MGLKNIFILTTFIIPLMCKNLPNYLIIEKGKNVSLTCKENMSSVVKLSWYNNNNALFTWQMINNITINNETNNYIFILRDNFTTLTIKNVSTNFKYSCNFTSLNNINNNNAYDNNQSFIITVVNKMPIINMFNNNNNNNINITCKIISDPISIVTWNTSNSFNVVNNYTINNTVINTISIHNLNSSVTCIGTFLNNITIIKTYNKNDYNNNSNNITNNKLLNLDLHYAIMIFSIMLISIIIIFIYISIRLYNCSKNNYKKNDFL
ncbi:hemagglutinin [Eptesipox virus]|uniref:Hemagglutinin n=1 Tax=Eptesipox virus TaxID=1329402 RepID=A0A220T6L8_9POXV|nr:hemagglutinin [Eptesipox virus]ASK51357.1 hemagglutinin [Eptesipox virus]